MAATLALVGRAPEEAAGRRSLVRTGLLAGVRLLVLPALVLTIVRLLDPSDPLVARLLGVETVLIVAAEVALAVFLVESAPNRGLLRTLIPVAVAGVVVSAGDVAALSLAFRTPVASSLLSVVAYDVLFGVVVATPVVVVLRSARKLPSKGPVAPDDATLAGLIRAYRGVLDASALGRSWNPQRLLADQLLRRHVRRTLEGVQRGLAGRAVEREPTKEDLRERRLVDDYLLAVPTVSRLVPIPTVASVFLLWKVVPALVAVATAVAAWSGGGRSGMELLAPVADRVPREIADFTVDAVAVVFAFSLLMLVLAPAIHRRDELLKAHSVCEREVYLMDMVLHVPRASRKPEYALTALPALPLGLYGVAVLVYAVVGLFVYPSPEGPLGGLVERADLMHLGPVTGAVLSQPFLLGASLWVAWIVNARKRTQVARA